MDRVGTRTDPLCGDGWHRHLHVMAGDPVTRGQVLATIDGPELRRRFTQEQASLQTVDVALGRARIAARQSDTRKAIACSSAPVT